MRFWTKCKVCSIIVALTLPEPMAAAQPPLAAVANKAATKAPATNLQAPARADTAGHLIGQTAHRAPALKGEPAAGIAISVVDPRLTLLGIILTFVLAVMAVVNAIWTRESNRFANSVGMYRRYLELCVKYPEFAEPYPIDRWKDSNDPEYRQYQWFLGVLFRACDEVLAHGKEKGRWSDTVMDQLRHHVEFIKNNSWLNGGGINLYSPALRRLVERVRAEALDAE